MKNLALDIETTGVNIDHDTITCVALVGEDFELSWHMGPGYDHETRREELKSHLDTCDRILTYNGALFDIPFLQRYYGFKNAEVGTWMLKMVDPFFSARSLLGREVCPKLSQILLLNHIQPKTACGSDAVIMAREGRWEELKDYCVNDTKITFDLLNRDSINWVSGLTYTPHKKLQWHVAEV